MAKIEQFYKNDISHDFFDYVKSSKGDVDNISGIENVKANLYRRLITKPGSLAHQPLYGVGVQDYLNSPNSLENQRSLAVRIKEQFEQDSRVKEVIGMKVLADDEKSDRLTIFVKVDLEGYGEETIGFVPFGETV